MSATFTIPLITVIAGQTITASLWNSEFENIDTNFTPAGMDDYSATDGQMQTTTDPYPASATSRPTSLQGEIERLRYQIAQITGETYWYQDPDVSLATMAILIPSGTKMAFYQASVPTGWTAVAVNDKFIRVVTNGTTGGTTGGTVAASTSLAHTHTVASHTHDLGNHTHSLANHTHANSAHTHTITHSGWSGNASNPGVGFLVASSGITSAPTGTIFATSGIASGSTTPSDVGVPSTNTSGTPSSNTSGATAPSTDSQLGAFAYADFCVGSKD